MTTSRSETTEEQPRIPKELPVLPLRDLVVYPFIIVPLSVSREKSIKAVEKALAENRMILLLAQKDSQTEEPGEKDLYQTGTVGVIMRMLKLPDSRIRVLVQGVCRAKVESYNRREPYLEARIARIADPVLESSLESEALIKSTKKSLERSVSLGKAISSEVMVIAGNLEDPGRLADLIASNLDLKIDDAQMLLKIIDPLQRLKRTHELLNREIELLTMQQEINTHAREEIDKSQREYFLRQQLKAIQSELGEGNDLAEEVEALRAKMRKAKMPKKVQEEVERQINKLERMHPDSAETATVRNYLDWMVNLPWSVQTKDNLDLAKAQAILDEDHYGLETIKERLIEYLAVRKLKKKMRGPILCFVGPPGVGKTSLGRSIARALGRKFVRISLGGVRDEAEIRGHRRTYVGSMPGRIIQGISQAGSNNPVFMLDEVDKIGADYRGDPSAALLEVLDPEQNYSFRDHYLNVPFDLSNVLFVATANLLDPIQPAFRDRMEVISLSGYTEEEKVEIAKRHLLPKQIEENGLTTGQMDLNDRTLRTIIEKYTREAGLRNLEREIAKVCRKLARRVADGQSGPFHVTPKLAETLLGVPRVTPEMALLRDQVGVATGLAWTAAGGEILFVEATTMPGRGRLILTGHLGAVMKESAQAALSWARSRSADFGFNTAAFGDLDVHVHVPEGAIPKDGPSAGITMATAILSVLTGRPVKRSLAMTGEITLRGNVLPIGGVKEKVLAARRADIRTVILPEANRRNLEDVPKLFRKGLRFVFVSEVTQVLQEALLDPIARRAGPRVGTERTVANL
ncbi:MAG TPA: endopeptidase La [Patescibacteria group bacterium]|nr:endopeptidase La [Patescibacteria group bacterium]